MVNQNEAALMLSAIIISVSYTTGKGVTQFTTDERSKFGSIILPKY